ncbi:amino acid ABC transporter substrate-binding protein [Deinococcus metallilatus]|uniref:Amino acid ABC transporter substrate-binding protein n=1 Tax=Deinococcus metallilatus TaxID=1211322 RepID=A0AAJ5F7G6_9DEIO|nr:ABC transporter substrate-binding protein [Deinococcus metallilatus]MBB5294970.1 branched-chain amino acid transport system substrate-binding protein [Deinococcus metallilatus]QBY09337.1 amino acid ABC transporter substrate-binding protein [Deinococcus metallilatus]RXJ09342.1 amino acid ABC transporter substrate-binding protein [Deinococcus metallilatus]TLK28864.1 amino acid ABC transporter substrate-binding protein [Deinococcus metallilatus]GMA16902.1 branched-chain amino acid ABC transpor
MRKTLTLGLALALSALSAAHAQGTIKIGAITSVTGRFAEFGKMQLAGFKVGVDEVNRKGGVLGRKIELVIEDNASDVNKGLAAAERLVNAGVPLVLNEYSSSLVKAQAQYLARQKVPALVFSSSGDDITKPGNDYIFRLNQPATEYARAILNIFRANKFKNMAIIAGTGAFEKSVADAAQDIAKEYGIAVVEDQRYDKGLTDFRPVLNRIKAKNPDGILMVSYAEDSVALMRQAREVGVKPRLFAGGAAGFALPDFVKDAGTAAENVVTATAWIPQLRYPGTQKLNVELKKALGGQDPSYHAAQAYAAVLAAAEAIRRADSTDREKVKAALGSLNMQTAFGPIQFKDYSGFRNQNPLTMVAQQVQNGAFVPVYPASVVPRPIKFER